MTWRPRLGTSAARRAATTGAPPPPEDEEGAPERAPHAEQDRPDVLGPRRARLADDPALGRQAETPTEIPPPGWRAVLGRVWREASGDQIPMVPASCGFFPPPALFPRLPFLFSPL